MFVNLFTEKKKSSHAGVTKHAIILLFSYYGNFIYVKNYTVCTETITFWRYIRKIGTLAQYIANIGLPLWLFLDFPWCAQ